MELFHDIIGRDADTILWWQMAVRAVVIFLYLLVLVRLSGCRAFSHWTPFDIVLGVLLGSALSRALTANAPFWPTLAAGAALVGLHVLLAFLAMRSDLVGFLVKGRPTMVVEDGRILHRNLRRCQVSEEDLRERLRTELNLEDLSHVARAYLERGGNVSFIPR